MEILFHTDPPSEMLIVENLIFLPSSAETVKQSTSHHQTSKLTYMCPNAIVQTEASGGVKWNCVEVVERLRL